MTTLPPGSVIEGKPALWLHADWRLARTPAGACAHPGDLAAVAAEWHDATVPGTVASSIHADLDAAGDYDADDWWYRTEFKLEYAAAARYRLRFDGLATLAEVWLNGTRIVSSRNMFLAQRVDVTERLRDENRLAICFRSLTAALAQRRARPRWKAALVAHQNLRWFRTTLLGRIPGWTPPITPVGPWGPIALECIERAELSALRVHATAEGATGRLALRATVASLGGARIDAARVRLGEADHPADLRDGTITADIAMADAPLWWPHTHGAPQLLPCRLELRVDGEWRRIDCGPVGFKRIEATFAPAGMQLTVNGSKVFCRGACWTTADILALRGERAALRRALESAREAGINMLRVGGTMTYESDDFYRLCDELGILVWQDFMFANMDYPVGDADFRAEIEAEARHQLDRFQRHACIAVYCGGSEVSQQAAMLGFPAELWTNEFFADALPRLCGERHPGIPYFPSTPWGGALPFHVGSGVAHYYGVGAYRRPLADVKTAGVKFAAECLGFSNVPAAQTMALVLHGATPPPHHPRWKARVPRDAGAGYDFEDVRDHYLKVLFDEDPVALRGRDLERYFAVSRVVTGEVMARVFSEWRAERSGCGGALVWFFRDLWPGAGWGITDSTGLPKAAYWYLKRAWARQAVRITDEGLDGLLLHVFNEGAEPLEARLELEMMRAGRIAAATASTAVRVPAYGTLAVQGDAVLGYFSDSNNAYRFGPPKFDVIAARLHATTGEVLSEDFHFPAGLSLPMQAAAVETSAQPEEGGRVRVTLRSDRFLQSASFSCDGFVPDDNYFHLSPLQEKSIVFRPVEGSAPFTAHLEALNLAEGLTVRAHRDPGNRSDEA